MSEELLLSKYASKSKLIEMASLMCIPLSDTSGLSAKEILKQILLDMGKSDMACGGGGTPVATVQTAVDDFLSAARPSQMIQRRPTPSPIGRPMSPIPSKSVETIVKQVTKKKALARQISQEAEEELDDNVIADKSIVIAQNSPSSDISQIVDLVEENEKLENAKKIVRDENRAGNITNKERVKIIESVNRQQEDISEELDNVDRLPPMEPDVIPDRPVRPERWQDIEMLLEDIRQPDSRLNDLSKIKKSVFKCLGLIN